MASTKEIWISTIKGGAIGSLASGAAFLFGIVNDMLRKESEFLDLSNTKLWIVTIAPIALGLFVGNFLGTIKTNNNTQKTKTATASSTKHTEADTTSSAPYRAITVKDDARNIQNGAGRKRCY